MTLLLGQRVKVVGARSIAREQQDLIGKEGVIVELINSVRPTEPVHPPTFEVESAHLAVTFFDVRIDGAVYELSDRLVEKLD